MDVLTFTVNEAREYAQKGIIEEWVHLFLNSIGDNKPLSEGLKLQKRYWIGPLLIELDLLKRCCGPEPHMEYVDSIVNWEKHIERFQKLIREGWDIPPLIVQNTNDKLVVTDGNHRLEAMIRENFEQYWVIIWDSDSQKNLKRFEKLS